MNEMQQKKFFSGLGKLVYNVFKNETPKLLSEILRQSKNPKLLEPQPNKMEPIENSNKQLITGVLTELSHFSPDKKNSQSVNEEFAKKFLEYLKNKKIELFLIAGKINYKFANTLTEESELEEESSLRSICELHNNKGIQYDKVLKYLGRARDMTVIKDTLAQFSFTKLQGLSSDDNNKSFAQQFLKYLEENQIKLGITRNNKNIQYHLVNPVITDDELGKDSLEKICETNDIQIEQLKSLIKEPLIKNKAIIYLEEILAQVDIQVKKPYVLSWFNDKSFLGFLLGWHCNQSFAKHFLQYAEENDIKLSTSSDENKEIEYQLNDISIKESELDSEYKLSKICNNVNQKINSSKVLKIINIQKTIKSLLFPPSLVVLVLFIIFILFSSMMMMDKTVKLNLPENLSNAPIQASDSQNKTCEVAKIVSLDKPIHTIKCNKQWGIWPLGVKKLWIGGYKPIDIQSLQKNENAVYQVQGLEKLNQWRVSFKPSKENGLKFNSKKVKFFDTQPDCKKNINPHKETLLHKNLQLNNLPKVTKQPFWGKVVSGKKDLSYCAKGKMRIDDAQNLYVTFSFQRNTFTGKRKAVVIAPSDKLSSRGMGTVITETLGNWLVKLKGQDTQVPVTIFLIGVDGSVTSLVRSEDIVNLHEEGDNSILAKMDEIEFVSDSFDSLSNLTAVDDKLNEKFDQVLYLTDGKISGYRGTTLTSGIKSKLGIPNFWQENGVDLSILTSGKCNFWKKEAKAECFILDKKNPEKAKQQFRDKLNQLIK
jgi:hypothetical protein